MENEQKRKIVQDMQGATYTLIEKIGEGGQGMVLKTDHPNIVVKISMPLEKEVEHARNQIKKIMRLPLRDLKIALPLTLLQLKKRVGYVMELMDGLEPLSVQIERIYNENSQLDLERYRDSGSFERRLLLLKQLTETLSKLHGKGLAFGDLSPSNIFVSKSIEHNQVWLIDADNIHSVEHSHLHSFYTKGYAAPELIRNETGTNTQTDSWSFAVIALQLLTHTHPFNHGIAVENEDPDVAELKAERGEFPWVFDITDDSNELAVAGFPVQDMLNKRLFNLFQRCFGESRLIERLHERPTMAEWNLELHRTLSLIQHCQEEDCRSSYIANQSMTCPFCITDQVAENYVRLSYWGYDQSALTNDQPWFSCSENIFISLGREKPLYHEPYSYFDMELLEPWCTLKLTEVGLQITPKQDQTVILQNIDGSISYKLHKSQILKNAQKGNKDLFITHSTLQMNDQKNCAFFWRFTW